MLMALCALLASCGNNEKNQKTDAAAPVLTAVSPEPGATGVLVSTSSVVFSYDQNIKISLADQSRISITPEVTINSVNAYNNTNGDPGASTVSLGSTDLSGETWTLSFEWAACGGCNSKPDHTTLKAGDTNLFDLTGNSKNKEGDRCRSNADAVVGCIRIDRKITY